MRGFMAEAETVKAEGRKFPTEIYLLPKRPFELGGPSRPKRWKLHPETLTELHGGRTYDIPELPG